jgi:putative SOS response-associated peptidase YedK
VCGRFTQERPTSELAEIFDAEELAPNEGGHFNVAPTDEAAVVVQREERRAITRYRWGLVPHWAEEPRIAGRTFNARLETVDSLPAFRAAFRRRRCVVPVDSFYEWRRENDVRQPYRIAAADGSPLALAGLWAGWREPETEAIRRTFTIVTTRAAGPIAELHDRMPVMLGAESWRAWIDPRGRDPGELRAILEASEPPALEIYPVVRLVNNVRNDGPELAERLVPA